jgi:hypothetical protein
MPVVFSIRRAVRLRCLLPALLVLCLLLQAQAGVLRQLLGAAHWHRPVAAQAASGAGWWTALQAWRADLLARRPLAAGHHLGQDTGHGPGHPHASAHARLPPHIHTHDEAARHHHAPQDASVVALDAATGDGDAGADATAGSLLHPLALAAALRLPAPDASAGRHATLRAAPWHDAALRRLDRPPRA